MGDYEIKLPIHVKFKEKNKCIQTNGRLEIELMHAFLLIFSM
jgi:hypothetical protein